MEQTDPAPGLPSRLVIDAREPLERFQKVIERLEEFSMDLKSALADVISCLSDKDDANYELTHSSYEMIPVDAAPVCLAGTEGEVQETIELLSPNAREALGYVDAREELGKALLQLFIDFKLYHHGRLFYQIHEVLGTALVMDKIGVPVLRTDRERQRYVSNLDRQVALSSRLPLGRNNLPDVPHGPAELFHGLSPADKARFCAFAASLGRP